MTRADQAAARRVRPQWPAHEYVLRSHDERNPSSNKNAPPVPEDGRELRLDCCMLDHPLDARPEALFMITEERAGQSVPNPQ